MSRAYVILGMKRSGHHAIAYWIAHNLPGTSIMHNDCCRGWGSKHLLPSFDRQSKQQELVGNIEESPTNHIFNIEDFNPDYLKKHDFRKFSNVCIAKEIYVCMVLRDPFNWIASCMRCGGGLANRLPERIKIWKKQAHLFKNFKDIPYKYLHLINYNEWFSHPAYRDIMAGLLGLKSSDKGLDYTSPRGGGSSFDGMKFRNKATQMKVLDRWKEYQNNLDFKSHIDEELVKMSKKIFHFEGK